ncbi:hypothetical protein [Streptomyces sp. NPDC057403]|uniref:hypothetical protein n=1 Tax=Streptomyces sp. NPDC057403 TaxID=3346119 RepID=UPI0036831D73
MQHLLCRASWDADAVRDGLPDYVVQQLHDDQAILVVDEAGDLHSRQCRLIEVEEVVGDAGGLRSPQHRRTLLQPQPQPAE